VIEGERGTGIVCINGAAARRVNRGDVVIIANYAAYEESDLRDFASKTVYVDGENKIVTK
jgi:aspartate 1-decarboxylase